MTHTPTGGSASWNIVALDRGHWISDASCASDALCVASDNDGSFFATRSPSVRGTSWKTVSVDAGQVIWSVDCPVNGNCAAGDINGRLMIAGKTATG
jgi:hypothetical protein